MFGTSMSEVMFYMTETYSVTDLPIEKPFKVSGLK